MNKSLNKICILIVLFAFLFSLPSKAQWSIHADDTTKHERWYFLQKFTTEEWDASNFASEQEIEWFNDARYGMFIHFGLSTYIGKDLSWGMCYTRKAPDIGNGPIADSLWTKYPQQFNFENFDAKKWVEIAQKAGMKYIVTIAKHHDGFHMWDTQYSNFKVTKTPFGRNYLKEIADACHEADMKFGIYYSQRDWYHSDYAPVDTSLIDVMPSPPYFKAKAGVEKISAGPSHDKYIDYQFKAVRELCTKYGKVDIFWFDACWWGGMFTADMWKSEQLTRMIRELQPGIIINNRASIPGDFDTPEQKIGMHQLRPWESCMTLCDSWSWSDTPVKSTKTIVKIITATATGNGNTLMSWGPKWDGEFDPKQVSQLEEVGSWMKKYGYTIYNTQGGPWYPENWGGSTYQGNKVYVHITGQTENKLLLPALSNKILNAECLSGGEIEFKQTSRGIILDLRKVKYESLSVIIELTFQDEISGMAFSKKTLSKFSDPIYGGIIKSYENPNLIKGDLTIDLGKAKLVTGIDIRDIISETKGTFTVAISENGSSWKVVGESKDSNNPWEITVDKFNAGIDLPGVNIRFIKVSLIAEDNASFRLNHISVYGKE
ncbi:alpha-L-fucosidase [Polaribacter sp. HL-MS24]|uniref:alpha-L-fucosidase n=1 Tax=Polaribacter sp. HL-MS24 TaxID=3077735 RepID=UPI0029346C59|nr:alpha-L-fucosidase [Polaribacter sp. HL-MS24]WOC40379.1 alpha-L-fucosidase [Polaribacter sp. HL-MS24]